MTVIHRLTNDIPVIIENLPGARSITFGVYVGSGSQNETIENNGVAHAIEHMLFKGTNKYSAGQLADIMTELGGGINAYTSKENTVFYGKVLPEDFERALSIMSDMLFNSLFDSKEFSKEKCVIIDEIDSYDDSAEDMCHELLQKRVWRDNPLGFIISGSKSNVKKLTRQQLIDFKEANYTADNMLISVAGKCDDTAVIPVLETLFAALPHTGSRLIPVRPDFNRCFISRYKDMEQVHLNIAFDNVRSCDEDRYAMYMINSMLGGNLNSRLFQKVREENGLTYSIYSYNSMCDLAGLFHIYASMSAAQTERVYELIFEIIDELNEKGIDEDELAKLKKQTKIELILGSEAASNTVLNNAKTFLSTGSVISLDEAVEHYESVTLEQINKCIRTYLRKDKCSVCLVGNVKDVPVGSLKRRWQSVPHTL